MTMRQNWDVFFGTAATAGTITLSMVNAYLAFAIAVMSLILMTFRMRREWKNRNKPPTDE